jgi:transposase
MASKTQTGEARFQRAERMQIEWRPFALEDLIPHDHQARIVWAYVGALDLTDLYTPIQAVEGKPGRDPIDPKILLSLWLLATLDAVCSARRLERLCREQLGYQWICGGVSINYHTLADFRVKQEAFLDQLLTQGVAVLLHQGLAELSRVGQDGMRVRASASSSSFRRQATLEKCLEQAEKHLQELKAEAEQDSGAEDRRSRAARLRAAEDQQQRLQKALEEREKLVPKMERRKKGSGVEARASSTDPEARKMKMADGGFRPAFNVQFATTADSLVIVGVDVTNQGTDAGLMGPMVEQLRDRYGLPIRDYLADGGFVHLDDITKLTQEGMTPYLPVMEQKQKEAKGIDPFAPMKGDTPEVAAWRQRMGTQEAQEIYKERAPTAEFPNATARNRNLRQFNVRGLVKTRAIALWHALAHNFQRTLDLRRQAGLAPV